MFEAAQQFERAAAHAAQRAAADRVRRRLLEAIGPDEEQPPPAPRFDEQARLFFYSTLAPLVAWTIRACLAVLAVAVLSVGTYGLVWGAIMRGLDVRSRPVFLDYAPGGAMVPVGVVDLRSAKSAPWAHSCGDFGNTHLSEGDVCVQSEEDGSADATTAILDSGQRYFFELTLTLPESEVNRQLGVFMVSVGLRSDDWALLASSKQHSMLPYESALVSLFRKTMLLLPLASGLLSETRDIDLLCFDNYVDADSEKPMTFVELSIGVPHPASFPDTRQTIQIHSATLRPSFGTGDTLLHSSGPLFLFLLYALLALSVVNYRWMNSARNRQPYANFFDSDDDESAAQYADAASQDRWMGADIEIIEDDEDDSKCVGADWFQETRRRSLYPEETPLEEPTENGNPTRSSAPSDNLVSEDDESLTDKKTTQQKNGRGMAKSANSKEFPFGTIARDASVEGHEPMFASPKSKPSPGAESKKRTEGSSSGIEGKKPLSPKDKTAQLKEEMRLADMVMKGQSKYGSFTARLN
ncbi:hypothetical protein ACHAXT_008055 [Thalassiosira profunda]